MPGMNGVEVLCRALEINPDTVRVLLTGCPRHPPWPATKRFSPGTSIGPGSCWMGWGDDLTLTVVWKLKIQRKMTADFSPVALRSFCEV